jgi:hypothetical protein
MGFTPSSPVEASDQARGNQMHRAPSIKIGVTLIELLFILIFMPRCMNVTAKESEHALCHTAATTESATISLTLSAPRTTVSWDERDAQRERFDLPLVYLHRQGEITPETERKLEIQITGLAARTSIQIEAQSHHTDVSTGFHHTLTTSFTAPDRPCTVEAPCTFEWVINATAMPSDFYTLRAKDNAGVTLWENPHPDRPDFVALEAWDVALGDHTVRVFYATLFPFAKGQDELERRLSPDGVTDFIANQLVPIIEDTWHTQVEAWGFGAPLHRDWDTDNTVEFIITAPPYALFGGTGTYTSSIDAQGRPIPERRIWWLASNNCWQAYDSLESAYKAVFAHEFFHLMQWNVRVGVDHPTNRWTNLFIEAQGKFAATVQYPDIELRRDHFSREGSEYVNAANRFLTHRLNSSFRDMEADPTDKYDLALYWRFLYEQYGEMEIVRAGLEEMARHPTSDVVPSVAVVMDQALARVPGPFDSFEESLAAFARANYALRLENGRCKALDPDQCGGLYYDPDHVYVDPPLEARLRYGGQTLTEDGFVPTSSGMEFAGFGSTDDSGGDTRADVGRTYSGSIPNSYGIDFIEMRLDPALHNRPLTVHFQAQASVTSFSVQIWRLGTGEVRPQALTALPEVAAPGADGTHLYFIPQVDTTAYDRLALIITRLDANEAADPEGNYQITFESQA